MLPKKPRRPRALDFAVLRPAIVEAKLMTRKHVCDQTYVATLAEELRRIEGMIAFAEDRLKIAHPTETLGAATNAFSAEWFRDKSSELDLRLKRVEEADDLSATGFRCRKPRPHLAPAIE
jgi:hypothetical protein